MHHLLLVDDEHDILETLRWNLESRGHRVTAVASGEMALVAALANPPDAIVLDIGLPGISGLEVCRRLRSQPATRTTPIVFLSARDEAADRAVGREVGANDYVGKPFRIRELVLLVEALASRRGLGPVEPTTSPAAQGVRAP